MSAFLMSVALFVLATVALGLLRVLAGPSAADRVMAIQLLGTGGVAATLLSAVATGAPAAIDVALTIALLAAFAVVAFVLAASEPEANEREATDE
jgi:multicomponent Na+:H+ antiporter subunit F